MSKPRVFPLFLFLAAQAGGIENPIYLDQASSLSVNEEALNEFLKISRVNDPRRKQRGIDLERRQLHVFV